MVQQLRTGFDIFRHGDLTVSLGESVKPVSVQLGSVRENESNPPIHESVTSFTQTGADWTGQGLDGVGRDWDN